jgi:CheY-like chemotaxis protein
MGLVSQKRVSKKEDKKMARILVVDDALMMRNMIRKMTESAGHIVVAEAVNGEQAIELYQKYLPDLVTMDIIMPGTDGIEALSRIMSYDENAKVIMVSALGQQHKLMEALEQGAKSYVLKPITTEKLITVINQILSSSSALTTNAVFECGEGRHQESCDRLLNQQEVSSKEASSPFIVENKEELVSFKFMRYFKAEEFTALLKAVEDALAVKPPHVVFNFTQNRVLNSNGLHCFINGMESIIDHGTDLQIICYNEDYMQYFRNQPSLKRANFALVKKEESWQQTISQ